MKKQMKYRYCCSVCGQTLLIQTEQEAIKDPFGHKLDVLKNNHLETECGVES